MRRRLAWIVGLGAAVVVALRALGRRDRQGARVGVAPSPPKDEPVSAEPAGGDPRAAELRRRLDESRELVQEREAFEEGELPVDRVESAPDERRRAVHDEARAAVEEMRGEGDGA